MWQNLLFALSDLKLFHPVENVGDMLFYAAFGFVFVFAGITVLIAVFSAFGYVMKRVNGRRKPEKRVETDAKAAPEEHTEQDGLPPETVAAITAAVAAYLEGEQAHCDFVVKRIKRL